MKKVVIFIEFSYKEIQNFIINFIQFYNFKINHRLRINKIRNFTFQNDFSNKGEEWYNPIFVKKNVFEKVIRREGILSHKDEVH